MDASRIEVGMQVTYIPKGSENSMERRELGMITSWNDRFVFVDYNNSGRGKATSYEDLEIGDQTFICGDDLFGRCAKVCVHCLCTIEGNL